VRLGLVPVGDRGEVIAPLIGVAVLDGDPDGPLERHRILDVGPVEAEGSTPVVVCGKGDAVVGSGVLLLGAPGGVEVVFSAGAVQQMALFSSAGTFASFFPSHLL
jgi:hypothetical protein